MTHIFPRSATFSHAQFLSSLFNAVAASQYAFDKPLLEACANIASATPSTKCFLAVVISVVGPYLSATESTRYQQRSSQQASGNANTFDDDDCHQLMFYQLADYGTVASLISR